MKQGRETTQEERIQIVKDCLARGKNYGEMAMKYKVSYWTFQTLCCQSASLQEGKTALE